MRKKIKKSKSKITKAWKKVHDLCFTNLSGYVPPDPLDIATNIGVVCGFDGKYELGEGVEDIIRSTIGPMLTKKFVNCVIEDALKLADDVIETKSQVPARTFLRKVMSILEHRIDTTSKNKIKTRLEDLFYPEEAWSAAVAVLITKDKLPKQVEK